MDNNPLPRLDGHPAVRKQLLEFCRLQPGEIWTDPVSGHRVACIDACEAEAVSTLMGGRLATLAIQDPPYNLVAFDTRSIDDYIVWARKWVGTTLQSLSADGSLYIWLGADQRDLFQPLPDFM